MKHSEDRLSLSPRLQMVASGWESTAPVARVGELFRYSAAIGRPTSVSTVARHGSKRA